ncbi:hypothetical protein ES708_26177 [subsurface metagenome]
MKKSGKNSSLSFKQSLELTPGEKRKILKTRAKSLGKAPDPDKDMDAAIEILEFLLAYETYAIETGFIREVYPLKELTPLPCVPSFVLGIINVRGQILSVIDIKKFFNLPGKGLTDLNKVIILHSDSMEFGILADKIIGVRFIPLKEIQPPLPTLTGIQKDYLRGVTTKRAVVLDVVKILKDKNIIVHDKVNI